MTLEEIERELHQCILDSMTMVSIQVKRGEFSDDELSDVDDEIRRLSVEKIMERFFVRARDGARGIDFIDD